MKLWEEGQVESGKKNDGRKSAHRFRIHPPGDFGPPEMEACHQRADYASHHDVMEVGHDEIGFGDVNV